MTDVDIATLAQKARHHWATWLPNKTEQLQADGEWIEATQAAAVQAHRLIVDLQQSGYQASEAEEIALNRYILLPAEPAPETDWEAQELAEMEAAYQNKMRDPAQA